MFQLPLQHSSRWRELNLGLTSTVVQLLTSLRERLSSLKKLWIQWYGPESQSAVQFIDCFESASSLVDFGVYNESRFIPVAQPISQLTRYQLDGPWEEHKRILKLAPNLVEADITADFDDESWRGVDRIIDLPSLRRRYASDPGTLITSGLLPWRHSHFISATMTVSTILTLQSLESFLDRSHMSFAAAFPERVPRCSYNYQNAAKASVHHRIRNCDR
jgi:hypothetical protein